MARTLDFKATIKAYESGRVALTEQPTLTSKSITHYLKTVRTLATNMATADKLDFGDGFTTASYTFAQSDTGTFTISLNTSTKPQTVASGGFMLFNGSVTAVHVQNNSTTVKPVVTVVLAG